MFRTLLSKVKRKYAQRCVVLMYHRITDVNIDPWDLTVSPENFEAHLQVLKDYNIVPISDLWTAVSPKRNHLPRKMAAITFDDGYIDNYLNAKPLLEKYNLPASFFIATDAVEKQKEFWWDALERICLQTKQLPSELSFEKPELVSWKIGIPDQKKTDRLSPLNLYFKLCEMVRKMPSDKQEALIGRLQTWSQNTEDRAGYLTMKRKELLNLKSNPLFTLGAHTVTHPFLPNFSYDYQKKEIQNSVNFLEDLTGDKVEYLAYPHGGYNRLTLDILSQLNIKLAFTTDAWCFTHKMHAYTVPRFQVKNWDSDRFAFELKNWMNLIL